MVTQFFIFYRISVKLTFVLRRGLYKLKEECNCEMYDYFNMSCLDDKSALRLNIKVNSENLLPQKYNVGSLKVPADPSWPKIPPRKLANDTGDIIQPPCVITLTGTPRRSRTTVRTSQCQPFKTMETKNFNSIYCLKIPPADITKRKPACLDPRFKRVITGENQNMESLKQYDNLKEWQQSTFICEQSQFSNERVEKTTAEKDLNIQQITEDIKKPKNEETIQTNTSYFLQEPLDENIKTNVENNNCTSECKQYTPENNNVDNAMNINATNKTKVVNVKENVDPILIKPKNIVIMKVPIEKDISTSICDKKVILEPEINDLKMLSENQPLQSIDDSDGQILLAMDKKVKSVLTNNVQGKSISIPQYSTQCYSVQVPIITYRNVPLQISTCASGEINISPCIANNTTTMSDLSTTTQCKAIHQISNIPASLLEQQDNLQQKQEILNTENMETVDVQNKKKIGVSNKEKEKNISEQPTSQNQPESNESESYVCTKVSECNKNTFNQHPKMKSEQNLSKTENVHANKLFQPSETYNKFRKRRARANFSKKAKSYFQKRSRSGIVNSDCTLIWPGYQQVNSKHGSRFEKVRQYMKEKNCHYSMLKKPVNERNSNTNINCPVMVSEVENLDDAFYQEKEQSEYKCLQGSSEDDPMRNPIRIPLKTQELLSKSYLEYYNKLKQDANNMDNVQHFHQQTGDTSKIKRKRSKQFCDTICNIETDFNPEIQTIEKCSALSSIINKNLNSTLHHSSETMQTKQLYLNRHIKSSPNPTGGTQSKIIKKIVSKIPTDIYENSITSSTFISKVNQKRKKYMEKRFLKLKTIIFFGSMMYALVVFLPMIYDYFFYEDYDDYENLTYIELLMDYVLSSFREAFSGFFNTFYRIFFQPVRLNKKY